MKTKGIGLVRIPLTTFKVLTNPFAFFREIPKTGGYIEPMLFMVVMGSISSCLWYCVEGGNFGNLIGLIFLVVAIMIMIVSGYVNFFVHALSIVLRCDLSSRIEAKTSSVIAVPLFFAVFSFVSAAIMLIIWLMMGSRENYKTSYRCVTYISAITPVIAILMPIPYIGSIAGIAIMMFFLVTASVKTHGISNKKASIVFGVAGAMLVLISLFNDFGEKKHVSMM